jgi:hypothetical protein
MEHPLDSVNLTELIELCREAGLGNFSRGDGREALYAALEDDVLPEDCPLDEKRVLMENHIKKNYRRLRTQLPGCSGKCITHGCPDLIVQRCWVGFKDDMI